MPATPTTKSQVQAFKFVLRRMESALVRRDAVMLHEPMRAHMRATTVGVIVSALVCIGFVLASVLSPAGNVGDEKGIVVSDTGAVFVIGQNPKRLIPVPNITSARLLLMSEGGGTDASAAPKTVDDSALRSLPHDVMYGMPNAPTLLPDPSNQVAADWAVCDQATVPADLTDPTLTVQKSTVQTTVLAGVPNVGTPVSTGKTMLVTNDNRTFYLVYTAANPSGLGPNSVVRAKIDPQSPGNSDTFQLRDVSRARHISAGLLNAIPEVRPMRAPDIPGAGGKPSYQLDSLTIGQVFKATITSTNYYVVLEKGIQQVPPVVAKLLRFAYGHGGTIPTVQPSDMSGVNQTLLDSDKIDLSTYPPDDVEAPVGFGDDKVSCLNWQYDEGTRKVHTAFTLSQDNVPAPSGGNTKLVQADGPGDKLDYFYMPGGKAAVVRSITSQDGIADDGTVTGPLYLVSDSGVKYGLPNADVAKGLGLGTDYKPAPEAIMKLLPTGANLDPQQATRVFDTIPIGQGDQSHRQVAPSQAAQAPAGG